jgi:hypothetical protein
LNILRVDFNPLLQTANLDASLDAIFGLDQISNLYLCWNQISLSKIKSALKKQGGMKRCEKMLLAQIDQVINDSDILEICSYLPSLLEWTVFSPSSTLTIDGAKEWKIICPNLDTVNFIGGEGLPEEVKEVLRGLGVTFNDDDEEEAD